VYVGGGCFFNVGQYAFDVCLNKLTMEVVKMFSENKSTVILITRQGMGDAEQPLPMKLIQTYLTFLNDSNTLPDVICFYTAGVKLTVEGSPIIELLRAIEAKGVRLILCGTCLNFYGLTERVQVGIVGGMTDIIEAQRRADKVISL